MRPFLAFPRSVGDHWGTSRSHHSVWQILLASVLHNSSEPMFNKEFKIKRMRSTSAKQEETRTIFRSQNFSSKALPCGSEGALYVGGRTRASSRYVNISCSAITSGLLPSTSRKHVSADVPPNRASWRQGESWRRQGPTHFRLSICKSSGCSGNSFDLV